MTSQNNEAAAAALSELKNKFSADRFDSASQQLFDQALSDTSLAICLTDPNRPDMPIIFANQAFADLTGYDFEDIIGKNCRFLQGPATTSESLVNLRKALKKKTLSVTEIVNYRKDGSAFLNTLHMAPLYDTSGKLLLFYGSQIDTTETVTIELARRKRALELSVIGIWEYKPETEESYIDNAMHALFDLNFNNSETSFFDLFKKVHPDDQSKLDSAIQACFNDHNQAYAEDFRIILNDGKTRWIRSKGGMAHASDGSGDISFIGVSSDVTREKEYERALSLANDMNKTIADELDHRINNIFATIAALVTASARGENDAKLAAKKTRERIMAMASSNKLTIGRGVYGTASLTELVDVALSPYKGTSNVKIVGEPVALSRVTLNALGLVFHELSTNSVKYGALNCKTGQLALEWTLSDNTDCHLSWRENGGQKPAASAVSTGFGERLIDMSVAQIGGTIARKYNEDGLAIDLHFPIKPA